MNETLQLLVYEDDINLFAITNTSIKNTEVLLDVRREVQQEAKAEKTKHRPAMFMSRHQNARQNNNTHLTNKLPKMRKSSRKLYEKNS
jgi:hypothetical protein